MKYVKIENNGELDVRLITLMGGTTKSEDNTKIGEFGTGLKYSVGWLMREGIDLRIFVGKKEIKFDTVSETIQLHDFEIVTVNGKKTELTTSVGRDWKGWMICREIWCNAIDEGGNSKELSSKLEGEEGKTTFYIQYTGEIKETWDNWSNYFTDEVKLCGDDIYGYIYKGCGHLRVYKQGVLVHEDKDSKSLFNYDFPNCAINEMREYRNRWSISYDIEKVIAKLDIRMADYFISEVKPSHLEYDLDYEYSDFGESWEGVLGSAKIIKQSDFDAFKRRGVEIDEESLMTVPDGIYTQLATKMPNVSAVRRADKVNAFVETDNNELSERIVSAMTRLRSKGFTIPKKLKWQTGHFGDGNTIARVHMDDAIVFMSEKLSDMSEFELMTTIVEECEHFKTGYEDCTRQFQQHFINLYIKTLLK